MTQVVPEHVARAKLASSSTSSTSTTKSRPQRSNSATLSTISVTCDTDTSIRSRPSRNDSGATKKSSSISTKNLSTHMTPSHSSSTLINVQHGNPSSTPTSTFPNHSYKSNVNHSSSSSSSATMSSSLTTTSGMNIITEKSHLPSATSSNTIANRQGMKASGATGSTMISGATGGYHSSTRHLSNKHKPASFDEHQQRGSQSSSRGIGKSVLEHLVFVFPENVRKMLTGPKNLTVRTDESRQPAEPIDLGEPPSIDEVKSWAESFDKLMLNPRGRHYFRDFLRSEYSEENFLFWMSCESLKNEQNPDIIEEKARSIYEDYISILSPKEVSLDSRVREVINKNMVEPSPHTFDEAQLQIYTLMHRDSYPRFINSPIYRRLLRNEGSGTS